MTNQAAPDAATTPICGVIGSWEISMKFALLLAVASVAMAAGAQPVAENTGSKPDLAKAQQIVTQVCAACHGADGNSVSPANPSLAGQHADYTTLQLNHFKSGVRSNAIMSAMAAPLTPEDMVSLGVYFSQQKLKGSGAKDAQIAATGQTVYRGGAAAVNLPACSACHLPDGEGMPIRYPRLSGQFADYTYAQLKAFKTGERGADKEGKDINGKIMSQIASRMSDAEMQAVAQYAAGLR
jgi:cytochrome c553